VIHCSSCVQPSCITILTVTSFSSGGSSRAAFVRAQLRVCKLLFVRDCSGAGSGRRFGCSHWGTSVELEFISWQFDFFCGIYRCVRFFSDFAQLLLLWRQHVDSDHLRCAIFSYLNSALRRYQSLAACTCALKSRFQVHAARHRDHRRPVAM
jgi:hypothetical protein